MSMFFMNRCSVLEQTHTVGVRMVPSLGRMNSSQQRVGVIGQTRKSFSSESDPTSTTIVPVSQSACPSRYREETEPERTSQRVVCVTAAGDKRSKGPIVPIGPQVFGQ